MLNITCFLYKSKQFLLFESKIDKMSQIKGEIEVIRRCLTSRFAIAQGMTVNKGALLIVIMRSVAT